MLLLFPPCRWSINFISFFFLYPTVFNLKEVRAASGPLAAALQPPSLTPSA